MTDLPSNLELAKVMMALTQVLCRAGSGRADFPPPLTVGERQLLLRFFFRKSHQEIQTPHQPEATEQAYPILAVQDGECVLSQKPSGSVKFFSAHST